jgi:DNA-binding YbaB/EbfC family protein
MKGMGNLGNLMKQAQKLQAQMAKVQEELGERRVEGSAGGGMVVAVANGKQDILSIKIDPEVVNPDDVEMLEDLIVAAIKQAREKAAALAEEEMQKATAGLMPGLGGGMKLMGM